MSSGGSSTAAAADSNKDEALDREPPLGGAGVEGGGVMPSAAEGKFLDVLINDATDFDTTREARPIRLADEVVASQSQVSEQAQPVKDFLRQIPELIVIQPQALEIAGSQPRIFTIVIGAKNVEGESLELVFVEKEVLQVDQGRKGPFGNNRHVAPVKRQVRHVASQCLKDSGTPDGPWIVPQLGRKLIVPCAWQAIFKIVLPEGELLKVVEPLELEHVKSLECVSPQV
eukprot:CAMPEP_0173471556 /NCGR_PEP_ID=MMETSP1357-20121228/78456_1 /TAXON_ID=77926 /ORGANISM="Hemiselmis rufescens, Strain PCC563" /LENGTH=228 /DNA_ID=CAMNT_0014439869 /DNA_START=95 /DNA_END=781 /DNA_ORIENTATION=-